MRLSQKMQDAINNQINMEFESSYTYLAMAAYLERISFLGSAAWMRAQSSEEKDHAMRLIRYLLDRAATVELKAIPAPPIDYGSLLQVFEQALVNEQAVSESINKLYALALEEQAFSTAAELQWFLTEQVEEEKTARDIVAKLRLIGDDGPSLLDLDRELGARNEPEAPAAE